MEPYLAALLGGLLVIVSGVIITLLRGLNAKSAKHDESFARLETILTGATGDNGLVGDMKAQRERTHGLANDIQAVLYRLAIIDDRRGGAERRAEA